MKKIRITQLSIRNFKGIKELDINFNENTQDILGANATGKTTIFDAILWLLFGKDHNDRKDFELKPLDENNQPLHRVDNEVTATIMIDGKDQTFKRVNREKWVKKRGETEPEFSGHETLFYQNDAPLKAGEYMDAISKLIPENLFKLVTNPLYFNAMHWQDRRTILEEMAGKISDEEIASGNEAFKRILEQLDNDMTLDKLRTSIAAKKRRLREDLSAIPHRIDELLKSKPGKVDYSSIEAAIEEKNKECEQIDDQIADISKTHEAEQTKVAAMIDRKKQIIIELEAIETKIRKAYYEEMNSGRKDIDDAISKRNQLKREVERLDGAVKVSAMTMAEIGKERLELRELWQKRNAEVFIANDENSVCPTCGQPLPAEQVEEMAENFAKRKGSELKSIQEKGVEVARQHDRMGQKIQYMKDEIEQKLRDIAKLNTTINGREKEEVPEPKWEQMFAVHEEYQKLQTELDELAEKITNRPCLPGADALKEQRQDITRQIDELKGQLAGRDQIKKTDARIAELESEEKDKAQQLADLEKEEDEILRFTKARADLVESRINSMFTMVRFKMFEEQINGGESQTCVTLVDGVPWTDANRAAQINSGIDIINALSKYYGLQAFIVIDNRESTTQIIDTDSQIINLFVSPEHKELTVI